MSDGEIWMVCSVGAVLLMGVIGSLLGSARGRGGFGFVVGILLGPVGWIIILLLPALGGRKCPFCQGNIPDTASKCMHCASVLPERIPSMRDR